MLDVFGKRFLAALHAREAQCATADIYLKHLPPLNNSIRSTIESS